MLYNWFLKFCRMLVGCMAAEGKDKQSEVPKDWSLWDMEPKI